MRILGVIPSRYASSRFPGKPLADICGKSMIQRVYEQVVVAPVLDRVVVATDDERIATHVNNFGGNCLLTGADHRNGTSRCLEVVQRLEQQNDYFDMVVNVQGDEPFIKPAQIEQLAALFNDEDTQTGSLINRITDAGDLWNSHVVKVVRNLKGEALYFSRQPIPFLRDVPPDKWLEKASFYRHLGLYAYRTAVLKKINELPPSPLEQNEKLEQLCWLENGFNIKLGITDYKGVGIDTPEDLSKLINNPCD